MSFDDRKALEHLNRDTLFGKTCLVGWILRTDQHPFYYLIGSILFNDFFSKEALSHYCDLLAEDFRSPNYLFQEFKVSLDYLAKLARGKGSAYTKPWPNHAAQYAEYLLNKAQSPKIVDYKTDLITMLIMASLNGPRDYRPDLLIFSRPYVVRTDQDAPHKKYKWDIYKKPVDVGTTTAYLSRITFPTEPADARDWMLCESPSTTNSEGAVGTMTYPLIGINKVIIVRASDDKGGIPRFIRQDDTCVIPLESKRVSSEHAELTRENDGWYLTDFKTTNGTLLIRTNEDRIHLCRKELSEVRENHVKLENGDVICIAPDWTNEQPLQDSPAFVFQLSASKW